MSDSLIDVHYALEGNRLLRMGQRKAMGEKLCLEHGQILTDDHIRNFHKVLEPLKLDSMDVHYPPARPSPKVMAPPPNTGRSEDVEEVRSPDMYLKML